MPVLCLGPTRTGGHALGVVVLALGASARAAPERAQWARFLTNHVVFGHSYHF